MTALKREEKNKGTELREKEKQRRPCPDRSPMGPQSCRDYLHITPFLTFPTFVASKNSRTASVYLSDSNSLIEVLLGLATAPLTL